jgi:hypothetical protein
VKRRKANPWFNRGTIYRRAVDALRTAIEPMTAREVAERCLAAAGIAKPNKAALADLTGSILSSLRNHKGKGRAADQRRQSGKVEIERGRQPRRPYSVSVTARSCVRGA